MTGFLFSDEAVRFFFLFFFLFFFGLDFFVEQRVDSERSSCWVLGIAFLAVCFKTPSFLAANPVSNGLKGPHDLALRACVPTSGPAYRIAQTEIRGTNILRWLEGWNSPCFLAAHTFCALWVGHALSAMSRLGIFVYSAAASIRC